jgi:hypothetical protein
MILIRTDHPCLRVGQHSLAFTPGFVARSEEVELGRSTIVQALRGALNIIVLAVVAITPSFICHLNNKG